MCVCVGAWESKLATVLDAKKCKESFALVRIFVTFIFGARVMLLIEINRFFEWVGVGGLCLCVCGVRERAC